MKYWDILLIILVISLFSAVFSNEIVIYEKLSKLNNKVIDKKNATEFIHKSFINTCEGKGFCSLNQWQKTCRAMWNLEYIGWSNADEFMIIPNNLTEYILFGTWQGKDFKGEVYWEGDEYYEEKCTGKN